MALSLISKPAWLLIKPNETEIPARARLGSIFWTTAAPPMTSKSRNPTCQRKLAFVNLLSMAPSCPRNFPLKAIHLYISVAQIYFFCESQVFCRRERLTRARSKQKLKPAKEHISRRVRSYLQMFADKKHRRNMQFEPILKSVSTDPTGRHGGPILALSSMISLQYKSQHAASE